MYGRFAAPLWLAPLALLRVLRTLRCACHTIHCTGGLFSSSLGVAASDLADPLNALFSYRKGYHSDDQWGTSTPLMRAAETGNWEAVSLLLLFGEDVNGRARNKDRALHAAARQGNVATAEALLGRRPLTPPQHAPHMAKQLGLYRRVDAQHGTHRWWYKGGGAASASEAAKGVQGGGSLAPSDAMQAVTDLAILKAQAVTLAPLSDDAISALHESQGAVPAGLLLAVSRVRQHEGQCKQAEEDGKEHPAFPELSDLVRNGHLLTGGDASGAPRHERIAEARGDGRYRRWAGGLETGDYWSTVDTSRGKADARVMGAALRPLEALGLGTLRGGTGDTDEGVSPNTAAAGAAAAEDDGAASPTAGAGLLQVGAGGIQGHALSNLAVAQAEARAAASSARQRVMSARGQRAPGDAPWGLRGVSRGSGAAVGDDLDLSGVGWEGGGLDVSVSHSLDASAGWGELFGAGAASRSKRFIHPRLPEALDLCRVGAAAVGARVRVAPANSAGSTPLYDAARCGRVEIAAMLLTHHDPSLLHSGEGFPGRPPTDPREYSAWLDKAISRTTNARAGGPSLPGSPIGLPGPPGAPGSAVTVAEDVLEYVAERRDKVDPDTPGPEGDTSLCVACARGDTRLVQLLLHAGADVNLQGSKEKPPLLEAARAGQEHIGRVGLRCCLARGEAERVDQAIEEIRGKRMELWAKWKARREGGGEGGASDDEGDASDAEAAGAAVVAALPAMGDKAGFAAGAAGAGAAGMLVRDALQPSVQSIWGPTHVNHKGIGGCFGTANTVPEEPIVATCDEGIRQAESAALEAARAAAAARSRPRYQGIMAMIKADKGGAGGQHDTEDEASSSDGEDSVGGHEGKRGGGGSAGAEAGWRSRLLAVGEAVGDMLARSRVATGLGAVPGRDELEVDIEDESGYTPLFISAEAGRLDSVTLLMAAGADHTHSTKRGKTVLYVAVERGRLGVIRALLKYCRVAQLRQKTKYGTDVLFMANKSGNKEVKALLNEWVERADRNEAKRVLEKEQRRRWGKGNRAKTQGNIMERLMAGQHKDGSAAGSGEPGDASPRGAGGAAAAFGAPPRAKPLTPAPSNIRWNKKQDGGGSGGGSRSSSRVKGALDAAAAPPKTKKPKGAGPSAFERLAALAKKKTSPSSSPVASPGGSDGGSKGGKGGKKVKRKKSTKSKGAAASAKPPAAPRQTQDAAGGVSESKRGVDTPPMGEGRLLSRPYSGASVRAAARASVQTTEQDGAAGVHVAATASASAGGRSSVVTPPRRVTVSPLLSPAGRGAEGGPESKTDEGAPAPVPAPVSPGAARRARAAYFERMLGGGAPSAGGSSVTAAPVALPAVPRAVSPLKLPPVTASGGGSTTGGGASRATSPSLGGSLTPPGRFQGRAPSASGVSGGGSGADSRPSTGGLQGSASKSHSGATGAASARASASASGSAAPAAGGSGGGGSAPASPHQRRAAAALVARAEEQARAHAERLRSKREAALTGGPPLVPRDMFAGMLREEVGLDVRKGGVLASTNISPVHTGATRVPGQAAMDAAVQARASLRAAVQGGSSPEQLGVGGSALSPLERPAFSTSPRREEGVRRVDIRTRRPVGNEVGAGATSGTAGQDSLTLAAAAYGVPVKPRRKARKKRTAARSLGEHGRGGAVSLM